MREHLARPCLFRRPQGAVPWRVRDGYAFTDVPALAQAIERSLEGQFGLEEAEQRQAMEDYDHAGFTTLTAAYYRWVARQAQEKEADEQATATPNTPSAGEDPGQ